MQEIVSLFFVGLNRNASSHFGEVGGADLPKGIYYCNVNDGTVMKLLKE